MAQIFASDPVLLRDLPNGAMYVGREWWEFFTGEKHKLDALRACLRALTRDFPGGVPVVEIEKLGLGR